MWTNTSQTKWIGCLILWWRRIGFLFILHFIFVYFLLFFFSPDCISLSVDGSPFFRIDTPANASRSFFNGWLPRSTLTACSRGQCVPGPPPARQAGRLRPRHAAALLPGHVWHPGVHGPGGHPRPEVCLPAPGFTCTCELTGCHFFGPLCPRLFTFGPFLSAFLPQFLTLFCPFLPTFAQF